ncbi:hypothetical protein GPROT1_03006 [Gammaproteobacteria bacterium]|nr:hypothetical protein GPROT1_03006 [Gammaproteobacteria bacterium]
MHFARELGLRIGALGRRRGFFRNRQLPGVAVNAGARCKHEAGHAALRSRAQQRKRGLLGVALGLGGISQRARHARKRGEVDNRAHIAAQAQALGFIGDVGLIKREIRMRKQTLARAGRKIVHAKHRVPTRQQCRAKMAAEKTGSAGDKNGPRSHGWSIETDNPRAHRVSDGTLRTPSHTFHAASKGDRL